jgi:hypothetical protein
MQLDFVTQSSRNAEDVGANSERLVNFYPEPIPEGGRARTVLRSVLGTSEWAALPGVLIRALAVVSERDDGAMVERLFAVQGGKLWQVTQEAGLSGLGDVPDDENTGVAGNNGAVTLVAGGEYHLWDGDTLSQPAPGAFTDFGGVEFLGGYTILTERSGRRFQWSALADPDDLPGLNFAAAEARDDAILRPVSISGNLWLFKERSIEIWSLTGLAAENAFSRIPGAVRERGLLGYNLITKTPDSAFFVGNDGVCYIAHGTDLAPVSRTPVESAIEAETPTDCFYYEDEGHKFCAVRFRRRPAWVYDLSTGMWHERASGDARAWSATQAVFAYGAYRTGRADGQIATLVRNNRDVTGALIREATSRTLSNEGGRFRVPAVEFLGRVGRSDIGRDAQIMVQFSRDGGETWGAEQWRSLGDLGQFDRRIVFRSLGQARMMTARLRVSDPTDFRLWSSANVAVV